MKVIDKHLNKEYRTSKLFLEDLEDIESILNESGRDFEIKTEDFVFQDVVEFKGKYNNQKLTNIEITARDPYVSIELKEMHVRLYCATSEAKSTGIFYKIESIIKNRSRKPNFLYSLRLLLASSVIFPLVIIVTNFKGLFYFPASLIYFFWYWRVWYIRTKWSGEVIVSKRGDVKNYFTRNKDLIFNSIFSTLISCIITAVFVALSPRFQSFILSIINK